MLIDLARTHLRDAYNDLAEALEAMLLDREPESRTSSSAHIAVKVLADQYAALERSWRELANAPGASVRSRPPAAERAEHALRLLQAAYGPQSAPPDRTVAA